MKRQKLLFLQQLLQETREKSMFSSVDGDWMSNEEVLYRDRVETAQAIIEDELKRNS